MELLKLEHKKLWRKNSVRIATLVCFVYVVVFGGILTYQWIGFGSQSGISTGFGNHFDGYRNIRESQAYAQKWGGELNDETLQAMVEDYQRLAETEETSCTDMHKLNGWVDGLWPELKDAAEWRILIDYVEPGKLVGFYERRDKALEEFLEIMGQTGAEREFLLRMDAKVEKPYSYQWVEGWSSLLGSMVEDLRVLLALTLSVSLSVVFAGEWHDRTGPLVLTTRKGWRELARAKIGTGICYAVELFLLLVVPGVILQLFFMGISGWDMPIQCIKPIAVAPLNMLQAEIYEYAYALIGAIAFSVIVMFLSALVKNNFVAVLSSLAFVFLPGALGRYLPFWARKALDLLPLSGSPADIFRTTTFRIFGHYIWSPWLLVTVPPLLGLLCVPFAVKGWARRMKV